MQAHVSDGTVSDGARSLRRNNMNDPKFAMLQLSEESGERACRHGRKSCKSQEVTTASLAP